MVEGSKVRLDELVQNLMKSIWSRSGRVKPGHAKALMEWFAPIYKVLKGEEYPALLESIATRPAVQCYLIDRPTGDAQGGSINEENYLALDQIARKEYSFYRWGIGVGAAIDTLDRPFAILAMAGGITASYAEQFLDVKVKLGFSALYALIYQDLGRALRWAGWEITSAIPGAAQANDALRNMYANGVADRFCEVVEMRFEDEMIAKRGAQAAASYAQPRYDPTAGAAQRERPSGATIIDAEWKDVTDRPAPPTPPPTPADIRDYWNFGARQLPPRKPDASE